MPKEGCILIVDDDSDVLFSAKMLLKDHFRKVQIVSGPRAAIEALKTDSYDIVLLDMNYSGSDTSGKDGINCLEQIMLLEMPPVVIMMTAFANVEVAIKAMKKGATDFVVKPWQNEKLLATLSAAYKLSNSTNTVLKLQATQSRMNEDTDKRFGEFIGQSASMKSLYSIIAKVAPTDANVLITGENGTGKELVARSLHRQSLRSAKSIINVDLGALNENLFESELFGHVKGAFTDAREDRAGRFEIASGGTLFLDEIGNIPLALQSKLLTALQNRQVTRIGSGKPIPVDIRLICATNSPIYKKVEDGEFREDLLYRIKTIEINLPPLREREGDIELLAEYFLAMYCKKYRKPVMKISAETLKKLEQYSWPGNVRELQHAMERAVIMSENRILKPHDFFFSDNGRKNSTRDILNLDKLEEVAISKALDKSQQNISKAAKELGLSRAALYRKMEKHGIK
ncbi:MAG: sigma-54-dependent Fis family transcriptional regulator [Flavipsychrobacter sp.]|nr:sigma-54-dependent Fis family transcriptional regulator [Flavipsychrobacter sp.]